MDIKNSITKAEQEFPRLFAYYEERQYGTLFYNAKIKNHHDSNHAILFPEKIKDLGAVLVEICDFYKSKSINPVIYHPPVENYFINNAKILKANGYEFMTALDTRIMLLTRKEVMPLLETLEIKQVKDIRMIEDGSYCSIQRKIKE